MIDFQGGSDFIARTAARSKRYMAPHVTKIAKLKRKLQDSEKSSWRDRYRKYGRLLADERYRFPGELLAAYGVRHLVSKLSKLKAHEIPDLLVDGLLMDLTKSEMKKYHEIREMRNAIAHGSPLNLSIRKVVNMNIALRNLAIKIADHFTENFFVIEKYAP